MFQITENQSHDSCIGYQLNKVCKNQYLRNHIVFASFVSDAQCTRTHLNNRSLPRPKTTIA